MTLPSGLRAWLRWLLGIRSPSLEMLRDVESGLASAAADMPRIEAEEVAWRASEEARLGRPLTRDLPQLRRIRAFAFGEDEGEERW